MAESNSSGYQSFLSRKSQRAEAAGFEPLWLPDCLFGFQRQLAEWNIRSGRSADFADCGLGKSLIELVFSENALRKVGRPVLICTPLAVTGQFVREGEKFGIECRKVKGGKFHPGINVTNYEQLCHYNPNDFAAFVGDESGGVKDFDSQRRREVCEFSRCLPYRLLATATPAPNDYDELGNSSEILGGLGYSDMLTRFFKQETKKGYLGWGRTKYRLRGHAEEPFWRWVCSWARACRKPSDLGFDDGPFQLPDLILQEHEVKASRPPEGFLYDPGARTMQEQREEQRRTLAERCEKVAELVASEQGHSIVWCHLNDEADLCERLIPESRQIHGSMSDEEKEEIIGWFVGNPCSCQLKSNPVGYKMAACGNQNTQNDGGKSTNLTKPSENAGENKEELRRKTENTCDPTTGQTRGNFAALQSNRQNTTDEEGKSIKQTKNIGIGRKRKSKRVESDIQKQDLSENSASTDSPFPITGECLPNKMEGVPFVEEKAGTVFDRNCPSTTAMTQSECEGSSAGVAILELANSLTTRPDSNERRCTCGAGRKRVLISKPSIIGYGLNLQHCAHQTFFPSHSFEAYYQAVRRSWRFGQTRPVRVDIVTTDGSVNVMKNLRRKQEAADEMFSRLVALMHRFQIVERTKYGDAREELPSWLSSIR